MHHGYGFSTIDDIWLWLHRHRSGFGCYWARLAGKGFDAKRGEGQGAARNGCLGLDR